MNSTKFPQLKRHLTKLCPRQRHKLLILFQQPDTHPERIVRLGELTDSHPICPHCRNYYPKPYCVAMVT